VDGYVIAIDSKGDHLINEDAGRKVFSSDKMEEGAELVIRLGPKAAGRHRRPIRQAERVRGIYGVDAAPGQTAGDLLPERRRRGRRLPADGAGVMPIGEKNAFANFLGLLLKNLRVT
jgi:hypothetical protein